MAKDDAAKGPTVGSRTVDAYTAAAVLVGMAYGLALLFAVDRSYLGNADDGIYLYTAGRVAQGVRLYRDVFAAPPPLMLLAGALLLKVFHTLVAIRVYSIALQLAIALLTWQISLRLFADRRAALLAVLVYLALPIGFEYNRMFVIEPLVLLLSLLGARALMQPRPGAAGLLSAAALFTKLTFLPTLVLNIAWLAAGSRRKLLLPYLVSGAGACLAMTAALLAYAGPAFFGNLATQGGMGTNSAFVVFGNLQIILSREGMFLALAAIGLLLFGREDDRPEARYFTWYSLLAFCSFLFTARQGTYWHFFVAAEPSIAIFAGCVLARGLRAVTAAAEPGARWQLGLAAAFLLGVLFVPALVSNATSVVSNSTAPAVEAVVQQIEQYSAPGQAALAYPYLAFLADRPIVGEYADIFMWHERYLRGDAEAVAKVESLAAELRAGRVPIVALNGLMDLPPIRAALASRYRLLGTAQVGERIDIYVPAARL